MKEMRARCLVSDLPEVPDAMGNRIVPTDMSSVK